MFDRKTVVVVGAGASAEFSLPTGQKVKESALNLRGGLKDNEILGLSFEVDFHQFVKRFDPSLLAKFVEFERVVGSSPADSIDRLAWLNPSISELCKLYSVWRLFKDLYSQSDIVPSTDYGLYRRAYKYERANKHLYSSVAEKQNWIAVCVNKYFGVAETLSDLRPDQLTFVTFNYDPLLEEAIQHFASQSERFVDITQDHLPDIIHVHGRLDCPEELTGDSIVANRKNIKYAEPNVEYDHLMQVKDHLASCADIICLGFDFDPLNVSLLSLKAYGSKIFALNYDGNEALQNRLKVFGVPMEQVMFGAPDQKIGVSLAVSRGLLDRPQLKGGSFGDWL